MSQNAEPHPAPLVVSAEGARGTAERGERGWEIELGAGTGRLDVATAGRLLAELIDAIADHGGGRVTWRVAEATAEHRRIATDADLSGDRQLVQLRRSLPVDEPSDLATRPFEPGVDEDEWLRVNNAAFAWHPEQSAWTRQHLDRLMTEPWFDAEGLLVHPVSGPIDGFCWTKVHDEIEPALGEIFVIGVHPDSAGRGLGKALVLAGLDHLHRRGLATAMLYTEADNRPAMALYDRLGFAVHHTVTVFERTVEPQTPTPTAVPIA